MCKRDFVTELSKVHALYYLRAVIYGNFEIEKDIYDLTTSSFYYHVYRDYRFFSKIHKNGGSS